MNFNNKQEVADTGVESSHCQRVHSERLLLAGVIREEGMGKVDEYNLTGREEKRPDIPSNRCPHKDTEWGNAKGIWERALGKAFTEGLMMGDEETRLKQAFNVRMNTLEY